MGQALRGGTRFRRSWRRAVAGLIALRRIAPFAGLIVLARIAPLAGQEARLPAGAARVDSLRFTVVAFPHDLLLARSLLAQAVARDSFPGLPRPQSRVTIAIAPDARRFREWIGSSAPEWGAAIAFPDSHEIVMQGSRANSSAGDPVVTLRHELAHLALHEMLGDLPPRWFDEGYASFAAGEWGRDDVLATNLALALRGVPPLDALDSLFSGSESRAQQGYALAHRAVAEMAALDPRRGLSLFFQYWREARALDPALRRAYGVTEADFEQRWKTATRRRYGSLALLADLSLAIVFLLVMIGPLWLGRRQRDRRRLAALQAADEAQELRNRESDAAESALGALLAEATAPQRNPVEEAVEPPNDDLIK